MNIPMRSFSLCLTMTFLYCCKPAAADLLLSFSNDNGGIFSDNFDVQVGDRSTIGIYLQQTAPDTVLTGDGIVSWGFDLTQAATSLGTISGPTVNPDFDVVNHNEMMASSFQWE